MAKPNITLIIGVAVLLAGGILYYFFSDTLFSSFRLTPQTPEKVFHVGVVRNPPSLDPAWEGFQEGMRMRGYQEGKSIHYSVEAATNPAETKQKVEQMIRQNVDLIYVMGVIGGRAVKEVTVVLKPDMPVVFGVISNPVGVGLVASMQSSGNNLTGITPINEVVVSKRLEVFLETVPALKRIIFGWQDANTTGVENLREAARALGIELAEQKINTPQELIAFFESFPYRQGDGIMRAADSASGLASRDIIALAREKKIPLSGTNANDVDHGALMSYGANFRKIGIQAARLADALLKGAKPSDLPIELPEEFEFAINLQTATLLDITIPPSVRERATHIIR